MARTLPDDWRPRGIQELEPAADKVVRSTGSVCVTAGPGAGKTELLAQRASYLLETGLCDYPKRILAISFKRDAARNLDERVQLRSGTALSRRFDSFTFDAFAKRVIDLFGTALPPGLRPTPSYDVWLAPNWQDIEAVLLGMKPPAELGSTTALRAFAKQSFLEDVVKVSFKKQPACLKDWAAREFWTATLSGTTSRLTFRMITRLAGELLRRDDRVLRAYRASYAFAFLDEFQDTTQLQYWLAKILFKDSNAVLTAVGDPRQRIMGWAGALKGVFAKFEADFDAQHAVLHRNHRASTDIAPVVTYVGSKMAGHAVRPETGPPAGACSSHLFADENAEAEWIAVEVESLLSSGVVPRDIAVLVRGRATLYGAPLLAALQRRGVEGRVEDQLQTLLAEPIVETMILLLRAVSIARPGAVWGAVRDRIAESRGIEFDDDEQHRELEVELSHARQKFRRNHSRPPEDAESALGILNELSSWLDQVRAQHPQYRRGRYAERCLRDLASALAEAGREEWEEALDVVSGTNAIPILTIHKSKGLEYHAVFFLGLEDGAFWSFRKDPAEETNAFFVALSRAKTRVEFTFVETRRSEPQTITSIAPLYQLMEDAHVEFTDHT